MNKISVTDIVKELRTLNTSNNIVWAVYFGEPWREINTNYVVVRLISDVGEIIWNARLELKVIAWTQATTPTDLEEIIQKFIDAITWDNCNKIFDFSWFKVKSVKYENQFWPNRDDNNRLFMRCDFVFTYSRL